MTGWREKRREARWKRKARMRNLERINKNKKCLAAKIIWICSRLPWRRELKYFRMNEHVRVPVSPSVKAWVEIGYWHQIGRPAPVAFREGVSWNFIIINISHRIPCRLPWRRELKWPPCQLLLQQRRRLPWRRELRILAFRPYKCAVIERL